MDPSQEHVAVLLKARWGVIWTAEAAGLQLNYPSDSNLLKLLTDLVECAFMHSCCFAEVHQLSRWQKLVGRKLHVDLPYLTHCWWNEVAG